MFCREFEFLFCFVVVQLLRGEGGGVYNLHGRHSALCARCRRCRRVEREDDRDIPIQSLHPHHTAVSPTFNPSSQ